MSIKIVIYLHERERIVNFRYKCEKKPITYLDDDIVSFLVIDVLEDPVEFLYVNQ